MLLLRRSLPPTLLVVLACAGCHAGGDDGPTSFVSAPPGGSSGGGGLSNGAGAAAGGDSNAPAPSAPTATPTRTVEETDLYRLEGTRLYYLNSYRGLMVFDVSDVDHPKLLGRSPIFGSPVDMVVHSGVATVVVADWYGRLDDGSPFHGSIVRGLDATDPTNIKVLGEARLGGWVRDDRVVGDVLYAVSVDYGWYYGWGYADGVAAGGVGSSTTSSGETLTVSSVSFAGGVIQAVDKQTFPGYGGVFNVTPNSILLAHDDPAAATRSQLLYLDISDPAGHIVRRGAYSVDGRIAGWGADNGRWNLDFADGKTAHMVGCNGQWCDGNSGYTLSTVDFSNPDAPTPRSALAIPGTGWSVAARFDSNRLYLSPDSYNYGNSSATTPFQVYDLTDPSAPVLAGTVPIAGAVWNILPVPGGTRLFALGDNWGPSGTGDAVSLQYLDVTDPKNPAVLSPCSFGNGWAWTPAAGTFKAFTMDTQKGLVVVPFSGWDANTQAYNNGLQLIEFTDAGARTAGAAHSHGWVERGIFVGTRLVSLSDLSLSVVDYSNHDAPTVTAELTLARNVVDARPSGATIAEVDSDWWDNDVSTSDVRVLPLANAEETADVAGAPTVTIDGVNARVFRNGNLSYIVTNVRRDVPCPNGGGTGCFGRAQQIQVVDLSNGNAVLRGKVTLPVDPWGWWGWGWFGCFYWDWYNGADIVQFAADGLAFRRWEPVYTNNGTWVDDQSRLFVVDLSNPDAPALAATRILDDSNGDGWWGNMRVVGGVLYVSHYEWRDRPQSGGWTVRYYVDPIDLSDRKNPHVAHKINVPGILVGGSPTDSSILYTIDYRWDGNNERNDFDVVQLHGSVAQRIGSTTLDGWVGSTFVVGNTAYLAAQRYVDSGSASTSGPLINLHAIDLGDPRHPVDRVASDEHGWGWLLDVEGDRAVVISGWGQTGVDLYKLHDGAAPTYDKFVRTRGWGANSAARQDNALYLTSGYWGVQTINLD